MNAFSSVCVTGDGVPMGRGYLSRNGVSIHRAAFAKEYGHITAGHHIHHLCGEKRCVRPDHLVSVSASDHQAVFHSSFGRCANGHDRSVGRTHSGYCRQCFRDYQNSDDQKAKARARYARRRSELAASL